MPHFGPKVSQQLSRSSPRTPRTFVSSALSFASLGLTQRSQRYAECAEKSCQTEKRGLQASRSKPRCATIYRPLNHNQRCVHLANAADTILRRTLSTDVVVTTFISSGETVEETKLNWPSGQTNLQNVACLKIMDWSGVSVEGPSRDREREGDSLAA
jgi:hypothetical protein